MGVVGMSVARLEAVGKVTGQAEYCGDIFIRGTLWGAVLRSPHAHARITRVDAAKAEQLPGVVKVITAADVPKKKFGPSVEDEYVLASDKVRYVGEEVAAVAAVDQATAEKALALIDVVYEKIPELLDPAQALASRGTPVHEDCPDNVAEKYLVERGDVAAGFADSACVVEETFTVPSVSHCYLEPTSCLAAIDENEKLTVWAPAGAPFMTRNTIATVLNISTAKVRVIKPAVGGSFGARQVPKNALIASLLALRTKRPVRLESSRFEEFILARPRVGAIIKLKMGFAKDGAILAKQTEIIADNGACTSIVPLLLETMAIRVDSLYRMANLRTDVTLVYTNRVPTGAFRGFGNPQMHFAMESMLDMAAEKLSIDPLALRRMNATQKGDSSIHGWKMSSCGLTECIDKVRHESDWDAKRASWPDESSGQKKRGVGLACMIHVAGRRSARGFTATGFWGSTAWIKALGIGKIVVSSGEADVGQGCNTVFAQIAAEELGVPYETVEVAPLDTDTCPNALGSFSDRVTILGGGAVRLAAADLKGQLIQLAAEHFSVPEDAVVYDQGTLSVAGRAPQDGAIDIFGLVKMLDTQRGQIPVMGVATYAPEGVVPPDARRFGNKAAAYTFAAQVAEVEVDVDTGHVQVLNFTCAHDLGRAINPMAAVGQVEGALFQGIGYALTEEVVFADGQIANASFLDYKLPLAPDTFFPKVILVESNEPHGPFGAKGVAEPGLVPTAPAIANAIYHAIGVRITSLPITPDKIVAALEKKQTEGGKRK